MNIIIPSHLKKIPIIDQLDKLYSTYNSDYNSTVENPFEDYNYYQKSDPVKKFITIDLELNGKKSIEESNQDFDTVVNYLTILFYSVKGTSKVIELMLKYLNIPECNYSVERCSPKMPSIEIKDPESYSKALEDFCNALLYFKNFNINSDPVNLNINLENKGNIQILEDNEAISSYKEFNCYDN